MAKYALIRVAPTCEVVDCALFESEDLAKKTAIAVVLSQMKANTEYSEEVEQEVREEVEEFGEYFYDGYVGVVEVIPDGRAFYRSL